MQKYPAEIRDFLAQNVDGRSTADLVRITNEKFGTSYGPSQIRSHKKNHKLKSGTCCGIPKGTPTNKYPAEVRDFIRANYVGVGHQGMADLLNAQFGTNYTKGQMKAVYARLKLNSGRTGRFPKGHKPDNCAKKGDHLSRATEFGKGHVPHNHRPIGSEVIRTAARDTAIGYLYVKVADPNVWKLKHHLIWEAEHGPIPKGTKIIFADRNPLNLAIENLIAVSGSELVRMNQNGLFFQDPEATQIGVTIAKIKAKSGELIRRRKEVSR